ncbi:hypothetical protein [Photobacterium kishitanii]|uniref:Uncharacterized protein n=1 Tax=Photobacterium kishitanii TaxID=318456 RepID=A0A2T3KL50_9GAMM|nr:hypothetical protein [Photobacterium kishitanii]PSV00396.1 hypothetical protein C9J27_04510 [Photobacterium kishitanii]
MTRVTIKSNLKSIIDDMNKILKNSDMARITIKSNLKSIIDDMNEILKNSDSANASVEVSRENANAVNYEYSQCLEAKKPPLQND